MPAIKFSTKPYKIGTHTVVRFPEEQSKKLPSRGLVMVKGTINNLPLVTALEPDGKWSHWFELDKDFAKKLGSNETVSLSVESVKDWIEPDVPADISKALKSNAKASATWAIVTPMARWEWIRWVRATSNPETRSRRIDVGLSKLSAGMRRPCCFNSNMCTIPEVSKSGVLLDPVS